MSNGKRRYALLFFLTICLLLIVIVGFQLWHSLSNQPKASYGEQIVQPEIYDLCPGDALEFVQRIHVIETAAIEISRDWCVRNGVCSQDLHQFWENVILTRMTFEGQASRIVPESPLFKPGLRVEDDDTLTILMERPPEKLRAKVEEAVRLCPRQAISLVED